MLLGETTGETTRMRRCLWAFMRRAWPHVVPTPLVENWHLEALCAYAEEITRGDIKRAVANIPPGTGKTLLFGVFWPAWVWIVRPQDWFMYISADLGLMLNRGDDLIKLVSSEWYTDRFGVRLEPGQAAGNIETIQGGGCFSTSIFGKGVGHHCRYQIFDDPVKPDDAEQTTGIALAKTQRAIGNTFASRSDDQAEFRRLIVMQRISEGDPSEEALALGWSGLRFPMMLEADAIDPRDRRTVEGELLFPARYGAVEIARMRANDMTEDTWETQYQQRPSRTGGAIIYETWVEEHAIYADDLKAIYGRDVQSWDLAFKGDETSDFVAGQWWRASIIDGETHYFMLDEPVFERLSFDETLSELRRREKIWPSAECFIENKANGPGIESMLRKKFPHWIKLVDPQGSKVARAHRTAPAWRSGRVHILRGSSYDRLKRTLSRFPKVRRDDEVDAMTQVINALGKMDPFHEKMRKIRERLT